MATLTADEILGYRDLIGDACDVEDISDATVQTLYDRALALDFDADTTEAVTVVYMLRRLWGLSKNKVTTGGDFGTGGSREFFLNIKDMLAYWEGLAAAGGFVVSGKGVIRVGNLNLDIDTDCDDLTAWGNL